MFFSFEKPAKAISPGLMRAKATAAMFSGAETA